MKTFRKISLTSVMFAFVILALHAFVPHHHQPQGTDFICSTLTHHKTHTCTQHIQCIDSSDECNGDMLCGLSHTFLSNSEHSEIIPLCIECQSVIPEPNLRQTDSYFIEFNTIVIQEFISQCVPLRAPPVA